MGEAGLTYSFERLSPEIEQAFARLFPPEDGKTDKLLRWRFEKSPAGRGWIAVARDPKAGDAIVGTVAASSTDLVVWGAHLNAYQAVDLIVNPAYRGRGIFAGLAKTLLEGAEVEGAGIVWGFPNDNAAHGWFNRFGWLRFGTAPFMIRPIRTGYFLGRIARPLHKVNLRIVGKVAGNEPEIVKRFGDEFDRFWAACEPRLGCTVARGADALNWRFVDKPDARYRNVVVRGADGEIDAFVSTCILDKHDGRILYVMEALARPDSDGALSKLLRFEVARAADEGADVALTWCSPDAVPRRSLRGAGFRPFPDTLRPVRIHFGAKLLHDGLPAAVADGKRWYVSYFDSDTV